MPTRPLLTTTNRESSWLAAFSVRMSGYVSRPASCTPASISSMWMCEPVRLYAASEVRVASPVAPAWTMKVYRPPSCCPELPAELTASHFAVFRVAERKLSTSEPISATACSSRSDHGHVFPASLADSERHHDQ